MDRLAISKVLVEHNASIDCKDEDQMTPLGHAVEKGAKNTAAYLFKIVKSKLGSAESLLYNADSEGSTLLHMAVDSGITDIVELCLSNGARVREPKRTDKTTAFHLACSQGPVEMVRLLTKQDPAICRICLIDKGGMSGLHRAATNNQRDIVEFLLDQGASVDLPDKARRTPLFMAASSGATETVELLIKRGANITAKNLAMKSVLHSAVGHDNTIDAILKSPAASYLISEKDKNGFAPIHQAAMGGHLQNIHLFMTKNKAAAGITSDSLDTPLHVACRYGWLEIVKDLLVGRNVRMINLQNNQGKTPLHFAAGEGHEKVVELLVERGATVERDELERTPLHLAAINGSSRCVDCILGKHPDCLNFVDDDQNTALNLAALHGHEELVEDLLSRSNQQILMNNFNQNALDIAIRMEKKDVAMTIADHDRWRELMNTSSPGGLGQMKVLLIKMPDVAERILDRCVIKEGDPIKQDYKITYDFSFIQGKINSKQDPLGVLRTMAAKRHDKCMVHQVIFKLMDRKWLTYGWISLSIIIFLYLCYLIPLTILAVHLKQNEVVMCQFNESNPKLEHDQSELIYSLQDKASLYLHYCVIAMTAFHALREFLQMYNNRLLYFTSLSNYLEWTGYIFTFLYVIPPYDCKWGIHQRFGAVSLFFSWTNLILYFRKLSFYGQYVIMLSTMFVTLFKVLMLFFLFVMAFGTTFYLLLDNVDSFLRLEYSLMTMFVMTLGEMNYADTFMPWKNLPHPTLTNILFLVFALGMPIILMNMLVGLAVGDIDGIMKNAAMDRYVTQIEMLLDTEDTLPLRIRRGLKFDKVEEYPNRKLSLKTKIYHWIFGFTHPGEDEVEDDEIQDDPMEVIKNKLEDQENRIEQIYELLQLQTQALVKMDKDGAFNVESTQKPQKKGFFSGFS
ncbi:transient receptor potential cation channel subfamily A member 1-like isoform X2 [Actinia tenebrosa]|nr:transient receptor potential cation channel subfamily A member 1-like isoform X2 [Actinia tenebrosa]